MKKSFCLFNAVGFALLMFFMSAKSLPAQNRHFKINIISAEECAVNKSPSIEVYPGQLYVVHLLPLTQTEDTLTIVNNGDENLDFTVSMAYAGALTEEWLNIEPGSGIIQPSDNLHLAIFANSANLEEGYYQATIQIESNDPAHPMFEIPVLLHVDDGFCPPPINFTVSINPSGGFEFSWEPPLLNSSLSWDNGVNNDCIGLEEGGTFAAAVCWEPEQLQPFENMLLTHVSFYACPAEEADFIVKAWKGENAATELTSQPVNIIESGWQNIELDFPVLIDADQKLWVGYEVTHPAGESPAGFDCGPAIAYYGDMIRIDGQWMSMSQQLYLDYNWNISATINGNPNCTLEGYSLYSGQSGSWVLLANTGNNNFYWNPGPLPPGTYSFIVCANYQSGESCSEPASIVVNLPEYFQDEIVISPNPAGKAIRISPTSMIQQISIIDLTGKIVLSKTINNENTVISLENVAPGIYSLLLMFPKGLIVKKLVVQK